MAENKETPATNEQKAAEVAKEEPVEAAQRDVLEEDDDFEEFKEDHWEEAVQNMDEQLEWEDNWDDEEDDDDFAKKLRKELEDTAAQGQ